MSQEKVERRKLEKANRKKIMRKAKIKRYVSNTVAALITIAALGWIGYSAYTTIQEQQDANKTVETTDVNIDGIANYMDGLE